MATIALQEKLNQPRWQGDQPLSQVLDKLSENPFGRFQTMSPDGVSDWQPYSRSKAKKLIQGEKGRASFKIEQSWQATASISTNSTLNSVTLRTANKNIDEVGRERLFEYIRGLAQSLPDFSRGRIGVQNDLNDFYEEHDLEWIPECFGGFVEWYHLISPQAYQPFLSREEMLLIPAFQVQEMGPEGWIELVMYEELYSTPTSQSVERIVGVTKYINERRHDWTANAARPQKAGVR